MEYVIGVDGGATGTVMVLAGLDGTIRAVASGDASNHIVMGQAKTQQVFSDLVDQVLQQAACQREDCLLATFGLAAIAGEQDAAVYRNLIAQTGLGGKVLVESDVVIAWAAATAGQPGLAVIAGTGSSCFGVNAQGQRFRALGWDYKLADQGSGYWIGLNGLQTAIKAFDGRIQHTLLLDAMVEFYGLTDPAEMLFRAYDADFGKDKIAGFAREVTRCAEAGDSYAQGILQAAGEELAQAVIAVARKLDMVDQFFPVGLIGGVFRAGDWVMKPFTQRVLGVIPGAIIDLARYPAVIGALILGQLDRLGSADKDFLKRIENSSQRFQQQLRWKKP
jgi:N-acetylglucosamine kinase-like BadF-type ATPase